ncbi:MAG: ATP-dependent DNA helicase, partial [Patescibacteria group bacterium]
CQNILDCAYQFIQQHNHYRLEYQSALCFSKKLRANHTKLGVLEHLHCATLDEESATVCEKIAALKENDPDLLWSDIALLVRANDTARPFIERLQDAAIPYYVVTLKGLYSKPVIMDILAYGTVIIRPHDSVALWRVLSYPFFAFSPNTLIALSHYAHRMSVSLIEACQKADLIPALTADDRETLKKLLATIERLALLARTKSPVEVFLTAVRESGYLGYLKDGETEEKREALALLDALYKKIKTIAGSMPDSRLKDVMEIIALEQEAGEQGSVPRKEDESPDAVRIMTVHSAKGLEFRHVFIVNMVDRRFPTTERSDAIELPCALVKETVPDGDAHLEEERRLFYVALTRAKQGVYLTSSEDYGGSRRKKLSRFLVEAGITPVIPDSARGGAGSLDPGLRRGDNGLRGNDTAPMSSPPPSPSTLYPLPSKFSYSQLAAFEKCPLQYKYAFILKIPVFGKPSLSFGKTLHLTLQRFFQLILDAGSKNQQALFNTGQKEYTDNTVPVPSLETLFLIYDECWVDEWFGGKKQKEEYRERGREILKKAYEQLIANPPHPRALERDFTIKVGTAEERYTIKGRIDRVDELSDGTVEIIDYKTGTPKDKLTAEDKEQLLYYHIASQEVFGEKPSKLTYYYLDDGTTRSFIGSDDDLEKLKTRAAEMIARITKSDFAPKPGWNCKFCDFREICEYRKY